MKGAVHLLVSADEPFSNPFVQVHAVGLSMAIDNPNVAVFARLPPPLPAMNEPPTGEAAWGFSLEIEYVVIFEQLVRVQHYIIPPILCNQAGGGFGGVGAGVLTGRLRSKRGWGQAK